MKNSTANSTFSNYEFEELLSEENNKVCFDCGSTPASWASVNNSIYLCINCSSTHRGFGVNISYIRSLTIDTWNDTQMTHMKIGGNRRLNDLLQLYEIPKTTPANVLYGSKLLEYHRNQIKSDVNKGKQLVPPKMEEALELMDSLKGNEGENSSNINHNIYSVGNNTNKDFDQNKSQEPSEGFLSSWGSYVRSAIKKSKTVASNYASNVSDKVKEYDIGNKIKKTKDITVEVLMDTGTLVKETSIKAVEVVKDTSNKVVAKGKEVGEKVKEKGNEIAHSDTVQNLKTKVGSGVNYVYGKIFGNKNNTDNTTITESNHEQMINHPNQEEEIVIDNQFTSPDIKKD